MKSKRLFIAAAALVFLASAAGVNAQATSKTTSQKLDETKEVKIERGTVVLVSGNDLWVRDEAGAIKHFANVSESARGMVGGKEMGIHDLKPGMVLERVTTTTTSQHLVTTVQTLTAKVWYINPPSSVILTLQDGTNQQFKIPAGQMFNVNGKMVDAWGLKKGMEVHITKITEVPETRVAEQKLVSGQLPPPPPPDVPILVAEAAPTPAPAPAQVAQAEPPKELPKTGSPLPFVGLLGLLMLGASFGMSALRRS